MAARLHANARRGIEPGSDASIVAGRRILEQLTEAFGRMMLGAGFIHGDPHPGNIFVQEGAKVALIDCGQVKQIPTEYRLRLAEAILLVNEWQESGGSARLVEAAQQKMAEFGVTFVEDARHLRLPPSPSTSPHLPPSPSISLHLPPSPSSPFVSLCTCR